MGAQQGLAGPKFNASTASIAFASCSRSIAGMQLRNHAVLQARLCVLCREKGSDSMLGGVSLEYDPIAGPTKFMVGCEQGAGRVEKALSASSCLPQQHLGVVKHWHWHQQQLWRRHANSGACSGRQCAGLCL